MLGTCDRSASDDDIQDPISEISLIQTSFQKVKKSDVVKELPTEVGLQQLAEAEQQKSNMSTEGMALATADSFLNRDIAAHKAKVSEYLQRYGKRSTGDSKTDTCAKALKGILAEEAATASRGAVRSNLAVGVADTMADVIAGKGDEIVQRTAYNEAIGLAGTLSGILFTNPLLSLGVTMAMTMLSPVLFQVASPTATLYQDIMTEVQDLVKENNINQKLESVKTIILGTTEELSWVPELVETASTDVMSSYYLMVQHDLAVNARIAFGDCFDDLSSSSCKDWQEAGTLDVGLNYVQLHMQVFNSIYAFGNKTEEFKTVLKTKMKSVGTKYKCLLTTAYETYKAKRLSYIHGKQNVWGSKCNDRACNKKMKCQWDAKAWDDFTGQDSKGSGWGKKDNKNDCKNSAKAARDQKQGNIITRITTELETYYMKPINKLLDYRLLGRKESANPCASM